MPDSLSSDIFRLTGSFSRNALWRLLRHNRPFRPIATLRWYQSSTSVERRLAHWCHNMACQLAGIDLDPGTVVGAGLSIQHGWGLVINRQARLGRNVTLLHGVTIGRGDSIAADGTRSGGTPVIGDGVTVGPNASIVGAITIGEGARILPGAVVYFDVPPHALVGGNPGKILKHDVPEDIWNKVPFPDPTDAQIPSDHPVAGPETVQA